ncbi:MAG: RuBisCO large subunit C-terminal-like domain-containing protein [Thermoplasmata archaeon]
MTLNDVLSKYAGDDVLCAYKVTTDLPIKKAALAIAAEQSTGTWTEISTGSDKIDRKLAGRVLKTEKLGKKEHIVIIEFPLADFDPEGGGIPQILSVVAGNLFGLDALKAVRLEQLYLPKKIVTAFPGPKFGADGIYSILGKKKDRPLLGTIVKPKIGLSPKRTADYVYKVGLGGLTNSKDDETLTDQKFCPIIDRTRAIAEAIDRVRSETGRKMMHAINISTRPDKILELADKVIAAGATELMIDVLTTGFSAVQIVAEDPSVTLPLHIHRTMHGAITRNPHHGISMEVFALLTRICGGDALHVGTFGIGKMHGEEYEDSRSKRMLTMDLYGRSEVLPVCSGGVHPGLIPKILSVAGTPLQIQAGGGISGHPKGLIAGAKAMNQAVDAYLKGKSLREYSKDHSELRMALEKWGE